MYYCITHVFLLAFILLSCLFFFLLAFERHRRRQRDYQERRGPFLIRFKRGFIQMQGRTYTHTYLACILRLAHYIYIWPI